MVFDGGRLAVPGKRRLGMAVFALLVTLFVFTLFFTEPAWAQDLDIDKTAEPDPVREGNLLVYTITIQNTSDQVVDGPIEVDDELPESVNVVGITLSDPGNCTVNDNEVECILTEDLAPQNTTNNDDTATIQITVEPTQTGEITNEATVTAPPGEDTTANNNEVTVESEVTRSQSNRSKGNNNRRQYRPPRLLPPGFLQEQYEEAQQAENELSSLEEGTSDTFSDEPNEGTTGDGGAFAQSGDPDEFVPETSTRGNVVDEIPTEGPLPNTGGASLWAFVLPAVGVLLLGAALLRRFGR